MVHWLEFWITPLRFIKQTIPLDRIKVTFNDLMTHTQTSTSVKTQAAMCATTDAWTQLAAFCVTVAAASYWHRTSIPVSQYTTVSFVFCLFDFVLGFFFRFLCTWCKMWEANGQLFLCCSEFAWEVWHADELWHLFVHLSGFSHHEKQSAAAQTKAGQPHWQTIVRKGRKSSWGPLSPWFVWPSWGAWAPR